VNGDNGRKNPAQTSEPVQTISAIPSIVSSVYPLLGESRGTKIVYDPELDEKLALKDKRKVKPRYRSFGEEVRHSIMITTTGAKG